MATRAQEVPGPAVARFAGLSLDSGGLAPLDVAYETYGTLNAAGDNAILVCHALTGSAHAGNHYDAAGNPLGPDGWWHPLIGPGRALDTHRFFVVCSNFLGSCYGTSGPTSINAATGQPYGPDFPPISIRDMVRAQRLLIEHLGIKRLVCIAGGSLGGFQVLEWAAMYPEMVAAIAPIATSLSHSAWCVGLSEIAREAIRLDPAFHQGRYPPGEQPRRGLGLARQVAMVSYRSAPSFQARFGRFLAPGAARPHPLEPRTRDNQSVPFGRDYEVARYLAYQGAKLVDRFDANTYITITEAMDRHDVATGRGSAAAAFRPYAGAVLCMGINSDILYTVEEQLEILEVFAGLGNPVHYSEIDSPHGHDAFLMEWQQLDAALRPFINDAWDLCRAGQTDQTAG